MNNNSRFFAVISYITWIGWFIAFIARDRTDMYVVHHMNQAVIINIVSIIGGFLAVIPLVGTIASSIISIGVLAFTVMGIYRAATGSTEPLPLIGDIRFFN